VADSMPIDLETRSGVTRVAHIISQSISKIERDEDLTSAAAKKVLSSLRPIVPVSGLIYCKFAWARTAGAILERFGGFSSVSLLGDEVLNSPLNAFTATTEPHDAFDQLNMWLTPAKICAFAVRLMFLD
jgi:hypothetical protein